LLRKKASLQVVHVAGGFGNLMTFSHVEQRTKVRETVLAGSNVPRVSNVNFSISVGTTVPNTVHIVAVMLRAFRSRSA
jgi:hypothetical protein